MVKLLVQHQLLMTRNHFHVVLQVLRNGVVVPVGRSNVPFIEISETWVWEQLHRYQRMKLFVQ